MRWKSRWWRKKEIFLWDERTKTMFIYWPRCLPLPRIRGGDKEWRWLEWCTVKQKVVPLLPGWKRWKNEEWSD
jgi:hypothetical protein